MSNPYQKAIENSNIVSKTDINGIITFVNDEFCKISGYSYDELIGKNHNIVRHPEVPSSNFEELWETILDKKPFKTTVKNLTKDRKTVYLNTTITPILDDSGNIKEFIAIRYDVTSEVELKKSLEEKQKILVWQSRMASLGQMIGNIAHQWRQPLTELSLTLFNMKKAHLKNDEKNAKQLYEDSKFIIANMSKTIDDFSNFFNPQKQRRPFKIKDAINEALLILKKAIEKENINIKIEVPKDYEVLGISNELSQVLINLIQNAKDAFIYKDIVQKEIKITLNQSIIDDKKYVLLQIQDNAQGIDEDIVEKIFEPYFTTKHSSQGTGLGLFMSKMIIEKSLDGNLNYQKTTQGSLFTISIPI